MRDTASQEHLVDPSSAQEGDIEKAQNTSEAAEKQPTHHEYTVPAKTKILALCGYFLTNIGLTLYNKAVLNKVHFPWLLTALHTGSSAIGTTIMFRLCHFRTSKLTQQENMILVLFSCLFTINIAISNISLDMVSVAFHQVIRAACPMVTAILYSASYGRTFSHATYLTLIPVMFGVMLATTQGDISATGLGFGLTMLGVFLAAFKTIATNRLMTGSLALGFWEVLFRMSPLAFMQSIVCAYLTGEMAAFTEYIHSANFQVPGATHWGFALALVGNGCLAFLLNVSSFSTNKIAGALTMTVAANIKQCMTVALGMVLFNVHPSLRTIAGITIAVAGGVSYSFIELDSKRRKSPRQ